MAMAAIKAKVVTPRGLAENRSTKIPAIKAHMRPCLRPFINVQVMVATNHNWGSTPNMGNRGKRVD
jgi:hypothetical protein